MGLAAFNRAREQWARENAEILKAEQKKQAAKEKTDKTAAAAASKLITAIDAKAPEAVSVVGARVSYNALTAEQAAMVNDLDKLEAAEKTLLKRLVNDDGNKSAVSAGDPPDDAGGDGTADATDPGSADSGDGDNSPE